MQYRGRSALVLGTALVGVLWVAPAKAQSRSLEVTATVAADTVCLQVESGQETPDLRVFRDGRLRHETPESKQTCFVEDDVAEGIHRYDVEAIFQDRSPESGFAEVNIQRPAVRILDLRLAKPHVEKGDVLTLEGRYSGAISRLELDATALDSGFEASQSQASYGTSLFRVSHPMSSSNTRPVGVYPVVIRAFDKRGKLAIERTVDVTYLPKGRSDLQFPSGSFVAKALGTDPNPTPGLAIQSIERVSGKALARSNRPALFEEGHLPPTADALRVRYSVPRPSGNGGATRLEIGDANASGVFRIPVETPSYSEEGCGSTCEYEILVPFENEPSAAQHLVAQVATYNGGWNQSGPTDIAWSTECDADPATPEPLCFEPTDMVIQGNITFLQREIRTSTSNFNYPSEPQYRYITFEDETQPASQILVKAIGGCGRVAETFTNQAGDYELQLSTFCPDREVEVIAYSYGAPIQGRDVAVGLWTSSDHPVPTTINDFTKDHEDYTVFSGVVGTFVPDTDYPGAGGITFDKHFARLEAGPLYGAWKFGRLGEMARALGLMRSIRRAQDYMAELVDASKLHRINLVLTSAPLVGNNNTAFYWPGIPTLIYIPPRGEYSVFAPFHEMFHFFDEQTLGDLGAGPGDVGYGRWGEPLANVRSAMLNGHSFMASFDDLPAENLDYNWNISGGVPHEPDAANPGESWSQGWIWRIAWDLADGTDAEPLEVDGSDIYDTWNGWLGSESDPNNSKLHRVIHDYLPQVGEFILHPDYQDRGLSGPDLVDLLDGMDCIYGLSEANSGELIQEVMNYSYQYDHCAP